LYYTAPVLLIKAMVLHFVVASNSVPAIYVSQLVVLPNDKLDPGLAVMLSDLARNPFQTTLVDNAAQYELSPSKSAEVLAFGSTLI